MNETIELSDIPDESPNHTEQYYGLDSGTFKQGSTKPDSYNSVENIMQVKPGKFNSSPTNNFNSVENIMQVAPGTFTQGSLQMNRSNLNEIVNRLRREIQSNPTMYKELYKGLIIKRINKGDTQLSEENREFLRSFPEFVTLLKGGKTRKKYKKHNKYYIMNLYLNKS